jgi:hypothetical protein
MSSRLQALPEKCRRYRYILKAARRIVQRSII